MGGLLILLSLVLSTLLFADLRSPLVWAVLTVTVGFGAIGFADDWLKISKRDSKGLAGRLRLLPGGDHGTHVRVDLDRELRHERARAHRLRDRDHLVDVCLARLGMRAQTVLEVVQLLDEIALRQPRRRPRSPWTATDTTD